MNAFRAELTEAVKAALVEYRRERIDRIRVSEAAKRLSVSDDQFAIILRQNPEMFRISRDSRNGYKFVRVADVEAYVERREAEERGE